ncbi:hypothetical protein E2562_023576 [Oryza meyeriana var. granulata]|uniref:Uncharacterized protein n=1 Tax=Oryza meyeriana var. granulata TaxID=110450 RepID=A0A6G1E0X2_9ORYZ|nr:hypothetical protein E2562_023576 [Oryza meyeriana var. granulata]
MAKVAGNASVGRDTFVQRDGDGAVQPPWATETLVATVRVTRTSYSTYRWKGMAVVEVVVRGDGRRQAGKRKERNFAVRPHALRSMAAIRLRGAATAWRWTRPGRSSQSQPRTAKVSAGSPVGWLDHRRPAVT